MFWCVVSLCIFTRCLYFDPPYGLVNTPKQYTAKLHTKASNKISILFCNRLEASLSREYIAAWIGAVVTIFVPMEGYVRRFVNHKAHGLSAPVPTLTQAGDVTRLNIQERVKTLLKTELRHLESTSFSILQTKSFPFSVTWNQNQDFFGRWFNRFLWLIKASSKKKCLVLISQWTRKIMKWIGPHIACPLLRWNPLPITQHTYELPVTSQQRVCSILTTHVPS